MHASRGHHLEFFYVQWPTSKPSKFSWSRDEGKKSLLETRLLQYLMPENWPVSQPPSLKEKIGENICVLPLIIMFHLNLSMH